MGRLCHYYRKGVYLYRRGCIPIKKCISTKSLVYLGAECILMKGVYLSKSWWISEISESRYCSVSLYLCVLCKCPQCMPECIVQAQWMPECILSIQCDSQTKPVSEIVTQTSGDDISGPPANKDPVTCHVSSNPGLAFWSKKRPRYI